MRPEQPRPEHDRDSQPHKKANKAGLGAVVDSGDFEPWLQDAKPSIEPFYWNRDQELLLQNGVPKDVVISTDKVTDKILSLLDNPVKHVPWDLRGMVVGHVPSGKTANYTGLICKAADAGQSSPRCGRTNEAPRLIPRASRSLWATRKSPFSEPALGQALTNRWILRLCCHPEC
jgi:hypothetical protein